MNLVFSVVVRAIHAVFRVAALFKELHGNLTELRIRQHVFLLLVPFFHFIAQFIRDENADTSSARDYEPPKKDVNRDAARELYADCFIQPPTGEFVTFGNFVRLLPPTLPDFTGLNILSAGVAVAEVCKNRLEPCHSAFLASSLTDCRRAVSFSLDDPRLTAFLHGEELAIDGEKGWTAVGVEGLTVGFGKSAGGRLKNRYPKGLRLL